MVRSFTICNILILLVIAFTFYSCSDDGEHQPLDLINGAVDVDQINAKKSLTNPARIEGVVKIKRTQETLGGVKIIARRVTSTDVYSTFTKSDGSFNLYVEGDKQYSITAQKDGYDKCYFYSNTYEKDTVFSLDYYGMSANFQMSVYDSTPTFKVNYLSTKYIAGYVDDFCYDGTHLVAHDNYSIYKFNLDGTQVDYHSYYHNNNFISSMGTDYLFANDDSPFIQFVDKVTLQNESAIYPETPSVRITGAAAAGTDVWLISAKMIFKVNKQGALLETFDLTKKIDFLNLSGITIKNNFIYVLNNDTDYLEYTSKGYTIYKIDISTGAILKKGKIPVSLDELQFQGLAADSNNFWSLGTTSSSYDRFIKFSFTE